MSKLTNKNQIHPSRVIIKHIGQYFPVYKLNVPLLRMVWPELQMQTRMRWMYCKHWLTWRLAWWCVTYSLSSEWSGRGQTGAAAVPAQRQTPPKAGAAPPQTAGAGHPEQGSCSHQGADGQQGEACMAISGSSFLRGLNRWKGSYFGSDYWF